MLVSWLVLKRLYSRRSSSARYIRPGKVDPGISRQKKMLTETQEDVSKIDFEELESDFMSVHQSHREHVRQMEAWKEKEKYLIVERKYFRNKYPNFLTWHDKEQIQYLHSTNSEEWSIERLSEAFPALPEVIEKIVKNKWTKKSQAKIASHDKSVIQNWKDFKQGKLNSLSEELKGHLQKFSSRSLNLKPFELPDNKDKIIKNMTENVRPGEFSEIIASYQRLQSKNTEKNETNHQDNNSKYIVYGNSETSSNKELVSLGHKTYKKDQRLLTFKELQQRVENNIYKGKNISEQDKLILKESKLPTEQDSNTTVSLKPEEIASIVEHRHETNSDKVGFIRKTTRDMSHLIYPEKIVIPKEHYKEGYTYKLNDCYYDCDGEFLYRVPGMS